jgi:voltage-gated potassium channel
MTLRARVNGVLENPGPDHRTGQVFSVFLGILILLNILAVILSSFDELSAAYGPWFDGFEVFSVSFFTVEYLLRLWTAPERYPGARHPYLKHTVSFFALVDLLAVMPFYLPLLLPIDLRTLRVLRVFRLIRVFKLGRLFESFELVRRVFVKERDALLASVLLLATLLVLASCLMYTVEHDAQPDKFANIVATMWWAVVTLTTVGYGDVFPITAGGRMLSAVISILGIGLVALPTGIISSGFIAELSKKKSSVPQDVYRNKKNGQLYHVIHRAQDCTNARDGTPVVVYAPVDNPSGLTFVRDQAEFDVKFEPVSTTKAP